MALINCPECKQSVSTNAQACPHCGYRISEIAFLQPQQPTAPVQTESKESNTFSILAMVFGGVAFLFFPIVFAPLGIVMASVGFVKKERLAPIGMAVAIVGGVVGAWLGFILFAA